MRHLTNRPRAYAALLASAALALASCTHPPKTPAASSSSFAPPSAARSSASPSRQPISPPSPISPSLNSPSLNTPGATAGAAVGTVVVAAGDIACDPANSAYAGGVGTETECRQRATSDLVISLQPKAVLVLGDLQYEVGRLAAFKESYDSSWGRFKGISWPAPGNHEYGTGVTRGYFEYFGARAGTRTRSWYSTDIAGWHVISLNSNCAQSGGCQRGSPQEKWLRADLAKNRAKCTIAIMHHPRWTSGLHGPSSKVDGLWRALAEGGADVALAGHDHHYERFAPLNAAGTIDPARGVRSFIVGTGGRDLYPTFSSAKGSEVRETATFGVLKLTLRPAEYSWEFVPLPRAGAFTDTGSGSCH
ncbi:MAG: metallophosphoesterase [Mycobacteriales bacterium]